jgi:hypothetical protein
VGANIGLLEYRSGLKVSGTRQTRRTVLFVNREPRRTGLIENGNPRRTGLFGNREIKKIGLFGEAEQNRSIWKEEDDRRTAQ